MRLRDLCWRWGLVRFRYGVGDMVQRYQDPRVWTVVVRVWQTREILAPYATYTVRCVTTDAEEALVAEPDLEPWEA